MWRALFVKVRTLVSTNSQCGRRFHYVFCICWVSLKKLRSMLQKWNDFVGPMLQLMQWVTKSWRTTGACTLYWKRSSISQLEIFINPSLAIHNYKLEVTMLVQRYWYFSGDWTFKKGYSDLETPKESERRQMSFMHLF